jgi:DNA polymerase-1
MMTFCTDFETVYACYNKNIAATILQTCLDKTWVFHNAKFDLHMLRTWTKWSPKDYTKLNIEDTMHAFRTQYPLASAKLKVAAMRYLKDVIDVDGPEQQVKQWLSAHETKARINGKWIKTNNLTYEDVPRELMLPYAVQDVWMTLHCMYKLAEERSVRQDTNYRRELTLVKLLTHMEKHGWHVDYETLMAELKISEVEFVKALEEFQVIAPGLNIGSPLQLRKFLYETLGEQPKHFTIKTNLPSTDSAALHDVEHKTEAEIITRARGWKKARDKYKEIFTFLGGDGAVHTNLKPERAKTGRFGSSDPALQNVVNPKKGLDFTRVRGVFRPPPGREWLFADYSQIELRLFAHFTGDPSMIDAYLNDKDMHRLTGSRIYGRSLEETTDVQRSHGKTVNFARIYGAGVKKIANALQFGSAQNDPVPYAEAQQALLIFIPESSAQALSEPYIPLARCIHQAYSREFPKANEFIDGVIQTVKDRYVQYGQGFVRTILGRVIPTPLDRAYAGCNYIIQGSAADLLKDAMMQSWIKCLEYASIHGLTPWVDIAEVISIHDELVYEIPEGHARSLAEFLYPTLTNWTQLKVPIDLDFKWVPQGESWMTKQSLKVNKVRHVS